MYAEINNPRDYRAALYIRLSKEDDNEKESESVVNQRGLLQTFAEQQQLYISGEYVDDGWSGTTFDRPNFQRMIADIQAGKVNMVLTKDMSRLGRDYIQTGYYLERFFPENRVRYISLLDGVDTGVESAVNDITPFKAIMNDMYAKDISRKITSIKRDKQKKGLFIGGKAPYGYQLSRTEKNVIEVDEEAAGIVRKMFRLALEGKSCREIALWLNEEGVPSPAEYAGIKVAAKGPYSGRWSAERVTFMLKNETYIGNMVQGRMRKINYKLKKSFRLPPERWTVVEKTHEPLISREVFAKAQMLLESRRQTRSRTHDYLLKGLVYCHECGYPLGVVMRMLSGGRPTLYFVCRTYQRFTKLRQCTCHCLRVETATTAILGKVREILTRYLRRTDCLEAVTLAEQEAAAQKDTEKENLKTAARIASLTAQLDKVYHDKLGGVLEEADFQRIYLKIRKERGRLREKLRKLEAAQRENAINRLEADTLIESFLSSLDGNRELLCSLIERIELKENKEILIYFRCKELAGHLQ